MGLRYKECDSVAAKRLAKNCKGYRTARGWTQRDLARRINCDQPRVSEIESAQFIKTITIIDDLADAFRVDPVDLLRE
jgi:transcriptional regulator with XRE-family HTH domain